MKVAIRLIKLSSLDQMVDVDGVKWWRYMESIALEIYVVVEKIPRSVLETTRTFSINAW